MTHHWLSRMLLRDPLRVEARLAEIAQAKVVERVPNAWQVTLGALRMWHRVFFRAETIGTCSQDPIRLGWRARIFTLRPLRFPFLLKEKAIAPLDMSGLYSPTWRVRRHLMAAHHDVNQFVYDLQMLQSTPTELQELRNDVARLLREDTPRHRWLRDLVVYEGYHERLFEAVDAAIEGSVRVDTDEARDPDISFFAYLDWCTRQPETPSATWTAWRDGSFTVAHGLGSSHEAGAL